MADISDKAKKPSNSKSEHLDVGAPTSMDYICIIIYFKLKHIKK